MEATEMYELRAVIFDPNAYPDGWENPQTQKDFITAANEECDGFLPDDWYVEEWNEEGQTRQIIVQLTRYEDGHNLQPQWVFNLIADPVDDLDNQWIAFSVTRLEHQKFYRFEGFLPW
jgi:hypothetical protein